MLVQGSLFALILGCLRESVPSTFCSTRLSCLWFVQGSLFPLPGYVCIYVLLVSSLFLIYTILTFDKNNNNNNPKTKKKIIKINKILKITILNMVESDLSPLRSPK